MSSASIDLLRHAVGAMADGAIVADTCTGEVFINAAAREMLGIPADAHVDTTYLKDTVGFYPFELADETVLASITSSVMHCRREYAGEKMEKKQIA